MMRALMLMSVALSAMAADPATFLALDDSYTCGQGVAANERWPVQLATTLSEQGVALAPPQVIARTGWTTDDLLEAITRAHPEGPFALVSLQIGVNDQFRDVDPMTYRVRVAAALQTAVDLAGKIPGHVLALSIPDWGVTPFGARSDPAAIARDIDRFNAIFHQEATRLGVRWIDVTGISRASATDIGQVTGDGLHPSATQYRRWVEAAMPAARASLGSGQEPRASP